MQSAIPRTKALDETIPFLREGYGFVSRRCSELGTDVFRTRIMLSDVVCAMGADAAEMFYRPDRFTRSGAMPQTTLRLLQDKGSVQMLDGAAHRHRKAMFVMLMTPEAIDRLAELFERHFLARAGCWRDEVVLLDEFREILAAAVCDWAGIPAGAAQAGEWAREFSAMIEHAGSVGPATLNALLLRRRTERRVRRIVEDARAGRIEAPEGSALRLFCDWRDEDGCRLDSRTVAVEVINILRPTVAVARFMMFAALALEQPGCRAGLSSGDAAYRECFVQEVRRFYPFFPVIGGRALEPFEWRGHRFEKRQWVLLDLYGTNHDPRIFDEPHRFRPERFRNRDGSAFDFIPQGGGPLATAHRCPGEWVTIALMKKAVDLLVDHFAYDVPEQDLSIDLSTMPAAPASGLVVTNLRPGGLRPETGRGTAA